MMRNITLLLIFLSTFLMVKGQEPGDQKIQNQSKLSPDTASIFLIQLNEKWPGEKTIRQNDSVLTASQFYLPNENEQSLNALTGNAGLAYKSLIFEQPDISGFRYTPFGFTAYKLNNRNIKYFHTIGPYSKITYSTGNGKEQTFNVTHSQNIASGLTLGLDLKIINSVGLYNRQKSDNISFAGTAQYVNKKENYVVVGNYHNNRLRWRENGGIAVDSLFTKNIESDRQRIAVRLLNADNNIKESGFFIRQFYYFTKEENNLPVDNAQADTTIAKKLHRYYNPGRSNFIRHTFSYSRNANTYTDKSPVSGFYQQIYRDSTLTHDSVYYHEISNDISIEGGLGRARGSSKALLLRVGIEHIAGLYRNDTVQNTFSRFTPYAYLSANAFGFAKVEGKIWTTQGTPFNGDKGLEGTFMLPGYDNSENWGNLKVDVALTIQQPFYLFQYYSSNHFAWNNAFGQQTTLTAKALYEYRSFKAGFNIYNLNDYVYFGPDALPLKEEGSVSVSQIWASAGLKIRHFETQFYGIIQNSSKPGVISLPSVTGKLSAYYSLALFKRALHMQTGASVLYNTPYYADAYMPALRAFYVQNKVETGNYPYIDAFINIRVKRARMFLMLKHLNSGLMGYDYIMVPGYPMPDRGLRFGISWVFYD